MPIHAKYNLKKTGFLQVYETYISVGYRQNSLTGIVFFSIIYSILDNENWGWGGIQPDVNSVFFKTDQGIMNRIAEKIINLIFRSTSKQF